MNIDKFEEAYIRSNVQMGYMIAELSSALLRRASERAATRSKEALKATRRARRPLTDKLRKEFMRKDAQSEKFSRRADDQDAKAERKAKAEGERRVQRASDRADKVYGRTETSPNYKKSRTGADTGNLNARGIERVRQDGISSYKVYDDKDRKRKAKDIAQAKSDASRNLSDVQKQNDETRKSAGFNMVSFNPEKARSKAKESDKKRYKSQLFGGGISRAERKRLNKRYR